MAVDIMKEVRDEKGEEFGSGFGPVGPSLGLSDGA